MFDRAFRLLLPALMWPSLVIGMVLIGMQYNDSGYTIIFGGFVLTVVVREADSQISSPHASLLVCWPAGSQLATLIAMLHTHPSTPYLARASLQCVVAPPHPPPCSPALYAHQVGALMIWRLYVRAMIARNDAIAEAQLDLKDHPDDAGKDLKMVHKLFTTFDLDGGGDIDAREMQAARRQKHASAGPSGRSGLD